MPLCPTHQSDFASTNWIDRTDPVNSKRRRNLTLTGSGIDFAEYPDGTLNPRSCLRIGSNSEAGVNLGFARFLHGDANITSNSEDEIYVRLPIIWRKNADGAGSGAIQSGRDLWMFTLRGASSLRLAGISVHGRGLSDPTVGAMIFPSNAKSTTDTDVAWDDGDELDFGIYYKRSTGSTDGVFTVWTIASDGTATQIHTESHNITNAIAAMRFQSFNQSTALGGGNTPYTHIPWFATATPEEFTGEYGGDWDRMFRPEPLVGIAFGDVTDTEAVIAHGSEPGVYRHDWRAVTDLQFRVQYHPGATFDGLDANLASTSWVDLDETLDYWGNVKVTELTAGTQYAYRVQVRRSSLTTDLHTGPSRTFRTLATTGTERIAPAHCGDQAAFYPHPGYWYLKNAGAACVVHTGDLMYAGIGDLALTYKQSTTGANGIGNADAWRDIYDNTALLDFAHSRHIMFVPDDHDLADANNHDGSYKPGYQVASGLEDLSAYLASGDQADWATGYFASSGATDGTAAGTNVSGTGNNATRKELIQAQRVFLWGSYYQSAIGMDIAEDNGRFEFYRYWDIGNVRMVILDTRSFQDRDGTQPTSPAAASSSMLGARQLAWFKKRLDTAAADGIKRVMVFSPTPFGDPHTISDEWNEVSPAERDEVAQFIADNVSGKGVKVCFCSGDRHVGCLHSRFKADTAYSDDAAALDTDPLSVDISDVVDFETYIGPIGKDSIGSSYNTDWETADDVAISTLDGTANDALRYISIHGWVDVQMQLGGAKAELYSSKTGNLLGEIGLLAGGGFRDRDFRTRGGR